MDRERPSGVVRAADDRNVSIDPIIVLDYNNRERVLWGGGTFAIERFKPEQEWVLVGLVVSDPGIFPPFYTAACFIPGIAKPPVPRGVYPLAYIALHDGAITQGDILDWRSPSVMPAIQNPSGAPEARE